MSLLVPSTELNGPADLENLMKITRANVYYKVIGRIDKGRETAKAIAVRVMRIDDSPIRPESFQWFPKSQIEDIKYGRDTHDELVCLDSFKATEWILLPKKLLDEVAVEQEEDDESKDFDDGSEIPW